MAGGKGGATLGPRFFSALGFVAWAMEGDYWLFFLNDEVAGVLKFELDDTLYWPGFPEDEAAYVHKLVVCRRFVGTGFSEKMLD